jgi:DNA-directed RNA polymerase specialized sigma subunit
MSPELRQPRLDAAQSAEDEYFKEPESEPVCTVDQLHDALKILTTRQRFVVELRYGMRDGYCYPVAQVADMMGISHVAVVKLEQAAVASLAKGLHA